MIILILSYLKSYCFYASLLISILTMPAKMVNFTRELYDEIEDLAQKKYKGNFSQAMRIKLGEKPESDDVVLRLS